jgi:magnesium-transporting ATPase (P-type)
LAAPGRVQIDFVFSDKTGTLTRNQMQFRKVRAALGAGRGVRASSLRPMCGTALMRGERVWERGCQCSVAGVLYGTGYTEAYVAAAKREGRVLDDVDVPPPSDENDVRALPSRPLCHPRRSTDPCVYVQPTWAFNDKSRLLDRLVGKPADSDLRNNPSFIREFLVMLSVCHTVIPERDRNNPDSTAACT